MQKITYQNLNAKQKKLLDAAEKAMANAYSPYSGFCVGAALLTKDGQIITGANIENASYGLTICAERAALIRAFAMGERYFEAIAVIARGKDFDTTEASSSCGLCRQMLYEAAQISGQDIEMIMSNTKKDKIIISSINELLPLGFGPKDLGVEVKKYQK